jgi:hypothetical protein
MTPEAEAAMLAKLERELFSIERAPVRNYSEATEREHRSAQLRREIENVKAGHFKVGHP